MLSSLMDNSLNKITTKMQYRKRGKNLFNISILLERVDLGKYGKSSTLKQEINTQ